MITKRASLLCSVVLAFCSASSQAQTSSQVGSLSLSSILAGLFQSPVHQVTMNGTVNWTAGGLEDSGPVTLQAAADGAWTTTMDLGGGVRIESQTASGSFMSCQSQVTVASAAQMGRPDNCRRSATWFLPTITWQPSLVPATLSFQVVGNAAAPQVKTQLSFSDISADFVKQTINATTSTISLDPKTLLPTTLTYNTFPNSGPAIPIPVRVEYSDYHLTDGAQIPYSIKRYLNGTLLADITINSVSIQ